jgi:hypothetical protein
MRSLLRLAFVVVVVGGCATSGLQTISEAQWNTVPAAERAAADRVLDTELQAAQGELRDATRALSRASQAAPARGAARAAVTSDDDPLIRAYEANRRDALARIDVAKHDWQQAELRWLQRRVNSATAHLEVVRCDREDQRARRIDQHMLGQDRFDTAPFHGQLAAAQEAWYAATRRTAEARALLVTAGAELASKKEAYAQLTRTGPAAPVQPDGAGPMRLSGWSPHRPGLHVASHDSYLRSPSRP